MHEEQIERSCQCLESKWIKSLGTYFKLGRSDLVVVFEAPDEKVAIWLAGQVSKRASGETLEAMKR